jgi:outer membrane protein assembly factor BamB
MHNRKIFLLLSILILAGLLSGCTGGMAPHAGWPASVLIEDTLYTASGSHVYALNPQTGVLKWRFPGEAQGAKIFGAAPILLGGQVIVGDYEFQLHSLNPDSGGEIWVNKDAKGRWIGSPITVGDLIIAPNADYNLYALNANGIVQWKFSVKNGLWTQPSTDGTNVYVSSMDKNLYALDGKTGKALWSVELGASVLFSQTLADDGNLYVGTLNNEVLAISSETGKIIWRTPTDGTVWYPVVVKNGQLFGGDQSGKVFALNTSDGSEIWKLDAGAPVVGGPVLTEKGLFFGTAYVNGEKPGEAMLVTTEGQKVWTQTVGGKLYSQPVVSGDQVVFGVFEGDNTLVALDGNGKVVWSFTPNK